MRQDPVECLFSFICSSNNNIARITLMIDRLCKTYGTLIGSHAGFQFYTFPTIEALAGASEEDLRALGTGYRAKFLIQSAQKVSEKGGREWLFRLRETPHIEARTELEELHGVGSKVADCVCLFSLDKHEAIPVDTHVWQITIRDLDSSLEEAKSLTPKIYQRVGDLWRDKYGSYAGWAHTILFAADLVKFKDRREEALGETPSPSPKKKAKSASSTPSKSPKSPKSPKAVKSPSSATPKKSAGKKAAGAAKSPKSPKSPRPQTPKSKAKSSSPAAKGSGRKRSIEFSEAD
mmetsp:Transcript_29363/g.46081  ORF Transcript_29363/g.46081 Transcript_29363/m.46081 type:complete len:291 (+) Transcript_29363:81-953(+)